MEFKIVTKMYDPYDRKVIEGFSMLAYHNEGDLFLSSGTGTHVTEGRIDDQGVFHPGIDLMNPEHRNNRWVMAQMPDALGYVRDPHPGDVHMKLSASPLAYGDEARALERFGRDELGNMHFIAENGKVYLRTGERHSDMVMEVATL